MASTTIAQQDDEKTSKASALPTRYCFLFWAWLSLLLLAYYAPCLSGQADFFISDTSYFFQPLCKFIGTQLKLGIFPMWNPLFYCGMSQAAVPSPSLFYPPSYLLFLMPFSQGLSLYMIFHHLVFAAGSYLLAREYKLEREPALFVAMSAGLMNYFFALVRNPTLPAACSWLPLALFLVMKIALEKSWRQVAIRLALALSVSMTINAGRPEVFLPCVSIIFFFAIYRSLISAFKSESQQPVNEASAQSRIAKNRKAELKLEKQETVNEAARSDQRLQPQKLIGQGGKLLCWRLAAIVCGVLISFPVILPALEWSALSPRAHGQTFIDVFSWSANFYDFLSLAFSFPAGDLCELNTHGTILANLVNGTKMTIPFLVSAYLGPVILTFAFWAFANNNWKWRLPFILLFLAASILAAGCYTPVLPFLIKVAPVLSVLRYPVKLLVFPAMILVVAGTIGFDSTLKKQVPNKLIVLSSLLWGVPLLIALVHYLSPSFLIIGEQFLKDSLYAPIVCEVNNNLSNSMTIGSLSGLFTCAAAYFFQKGKLSSSLFALSMIFGISLSLFLSASSHPYTTAPGFYNSPSKLFSYLKQFLREGAIHGVEGRVLPLYTMQGLKMPSGFKNKSEMSITARFHAYCGSLGYFNTTANFLVPQSYGYEAAITGPFFKLFRECEEYSTQFLTGVHEKTISDLPIYRFCRLTGTQFVLTQVSLLPDGTPLPTLDDRFFELFGESLSNNSRIYKVLAPTPRFYFAKKMQTVESWEQLQNKLCNTDASTDEMDSNVVYIKEKDALFLRELLNQVFPKTEDLRSTSSFELKQDGSQNLEVDVHAGKPEILVMSDQYYPGWQAQIDGKDTNIINVNLFARAIAVPSGNHKIRLSYNPSSVTNGAICSISALIFLGLLSLLI